MSRRPPGARSARSRLKLPRAAAVALLLLAWALPARAGEATRPAVVLVGDTQRTMFSERFLLREQNDAAREAVMRAIAGADPRVLVILGDVVAKGGDEGAWKTFDRVAAPLRERAIPLAAARGNHEYFGDRRTMTAAFAARFAPNGGTGRGVIRSGPIAVVLFDSNFERLGDEAAREQEAWYRAELERLDRDDSVRFIVVCDHHPPFTNSKVVSPSPEVEKRFIPAYLTTSKAVLFASGHCHSYEHFREQGKDFVVTGGGGGPRQRLDLHPRKGRPADLFSGAAVRPFNYCRLDVEGDRLAVTMVCLDASADRWGACDRFVAGPVERP